MGELSVLNCTAGDIRIKLSPDNPVDIARAKRMITDMLRRGYILAIERDGKLLPVESFDETAGEYVIVEGALYAGEASEMESGPEAKPKGNRGGYKKTRVPMTDAKATGVPMSGGG